ncbi:MAG TPA: hypothetical protein VE954_36600 [Oligoflexus sp.]|uniref:hypothetical protein n=1 Tax=Oligoflexus sp. TaxID=1971216 RepID=UPI002D6161F6|nr:hypothetical protein [Oligoflexus sp.]HYX38657.1 hypothetical protein [Oligoflexus sp.]
MFRPMQAKVLLSCAFLLSMAACSSPSKQSEGQPESGKTESAEKSPAGTPAEGAKNADGTPSGTPAAAAPINIPELIGKMTWSAGFYNNSSGKVFTGFDGATAFKVLIDLGVRGDLPETVQLSEEQAEKLYTSPEFQAAAKGQVAKLSFEADPAFLTVKMVEEYPEGRVYEMTTVKAGAATAKGKFEAKEVPLAITIATYTAAQVTAGRQRYNTAVAGATPSPACATCHRSATGVDHSPYYLSQFSDAAVLSTVETGLNTDDNYQTEAPHKMTFTGAADKAGIVAYLRSLDPNLFPDQQAP